tara:strand:+ start:1500 stop:1949 length:450 start_codon:yes stop_codon:yes gene_type:complete
MATLTLTIKEDFVINGHQKGTSTVQEVTGVVNMYNRVYVIDSTEDTVFDFQADRSSGGAIEDGTLKYARFTHTGTSNTVDLRMQSTAANKEFIVRLSAGESYVMFFDQVDAESVAASIGGAFSGSQLDVVKAICSSGDGATLEVVAAQS